MAINKPTTELDVQPSTKYSWNKIKKKKQKTKKGKKRSFFSVSQRIRTALEEVGDA